MQRLFHGSSGCLPDAWQMQIMRAGDAAVWNQEGGFWPRMRGISGDAYRWTYISSPGLFGVQYNPQLCPLAIEQRPQCEVKVSIPASMQQELKASYYCCGFDSLEEYLKTNTSYNVNSPLAPLEMGEEVYVRGACSENREDPVTGVTIPQYSPGSSLWLVHPQAIVRSLLTRGSPDLFPAADVAVFLAAYGTLTSISASLWVPGGLLVPQMVIGAAAGRLISLGWAWVLGQQGRLPPVPWAKQMQPLLDFLGTEGWPTQMVPGEAAEPGILALAGAASFLSASGAIALFVLVLFLEITMDWMLAPVVIVAVLTARIITTALKQHGLYHQLINVQSLPFVDDNWHWRASHFSAQDILNEDLAAAQLAARHLDAEVPSDPQELLCSLPEDATYAQTKLAMDHVLLGDSKPHVNGFPVVDRSGALVGLVTRASLIDLIHAKEAAGEDLSASNAVEENPRATVRRRFSLFRLSEESNGPVARRISDSRRALGITEVMDTAPVMVDPSTPMRQVHQLIRHMGVRHVIVVNSRHHPMGVLTRKSLMPWRYPAPHHEGSDSFIDMRQARTQQNISAGATAGVVPTGVVMRNSRRSQTNEELEPPHDVTEEMQPGSCPLLEGSQEGER